MPPSQAADPVRTPPRVPRQTGAAALAVAAAALLFAPAAAPAAGRADTLPAYPAKPAAAPSSQPSTQPADPLAPLAWHARLQDGIDEAQRTGKPILVEVGAEWCGWCKRLEQEMAKPAARDRLAGWVRVRLDLDRDPEAAEQLTVGPIPALRALTPLGRPAASRDGYLPADDLAAWLDEQRPKAAAAAAALAAEPTDAAGAEALVARITDADPVVREAATRRLLRHVGLAAPKVVETFAAGTLAARLAALELLQDWEAPVDGMDPWESATLTPPKLDALKRWAADQSKAAASVATTTTAPAGDGSGPATRPAATQPALSPKALQDARRDLEALAQPATSEVEARAARERLARLGPALLPEVYAALKAARTDRERERLTALRYRLVASDALALGWPSGFDRLAAAAPANRHAALDDLAARVTPADSPLLLELFADPDPLVRERSLKLLQTIGGQGTTAGLVRLLRDPEPNVRAAVLKQLAAAPVQGFDAEVAAFAKTEADADLVVHAVRVLREAKTAAAAAGLRELLGHKSWRVRAEAAESLGKIIGGYSSGPLTDEQKADVYATMVGLLADPDEFVVSRAVVVLKDARLPAAIDPMVKAADRRPELAPDVVQALAAMENGAGVNHLRRFCAHPSPAARAAAVAGLVEAAPGECGPELTAALADAEPTVRAAGLKAVVHAFEKMRPQDRFGDDKPAADPEQWLAAFRGGTGRPAWANDIVPLLEQLAAGTDPSTRPATGPATSPATGPATAPSAAPAGAGNAATVVATSAAAATRTAAAVALAAVGKDDVALPILRAAAAGPAEQQHAAAAALSWLPWDARLALYRELAARADRDGRSRLLGELVEIRNPAAVQIIWDTLAAPEADAALAADAFNHLRRAQLGSRYYSTDDKAKATAKPLVETAAKLAEAGTDAQRLAALGVLTSYGGDQAAKIAAKLYADAKLSLDVRGDAFHVLLMTSPATAGRDAALAVLKEPGTANWELRKTAVKYLARGPGNMGPLRGRMYLSYSGPSRSSFSFFGGSSSSGDDGTPAAKVPPGLTADMLRPMLADTDKDPAASAAYLLALTGDRAAFDALTAYWREHGRNDSTWQTLVYQAVVAIGDDGLVPVLDEVYAEMAANSRYRLSQLYRAIRPMKGPNVMKLRKRMRDEVGAEVLQ